MIYQDGLDLISFVNGLPFSPLSFSKMLLSVSDKGHSRQGCQHFKTINVQLFKRSKFSFQFLHKVKRIEL